MKYLNLKLNFRLYSRLCNEGQRKMAEIIYLKDILLAKAKEVSKVIKKATGRPRLKPFRADKLLLRSSLVEKKKEDPKSR